MKKIKFRVWDTEHKCMTYSKRLDEFFDAITEGDGTIREWAIIMQFIGLKDNNGQEIYEGDIVECDRYETHEKFIVVVEDITQLANYGWMFGSNLNYRLVIGNIYENPEMVK